MPGLDDSAVNLDDLVTLSQLLAAFLGRSLAPEESSRLKTAYQVARNGPDGATLQTIGAALEPENRPR
ncbi:hypothetical protein [Mycobacteroides salmoniphilum]|uniref:Uncharacterized protein n=1 Tax=Mycobacteroides salmoniphilum TaxID=404941 RepID=A0A4R8T0Y4_9MYCO|nr:hypothetical protein [Mycobacteroides salmoniphilum]TEA09118.1 hypothetical protein CCUG60884_00287 [Mycobacteroides salmoniphilum]